MLVTLASVSFAFLTALAAQVQIPLPGTPVPMTLQLLAVLLAGLMLSPGSAVAAMLIYLAAGWGGLPVFSAHGTGLAGATAGYLIAFPIAAWLVALLARGGRHTPLRLMFSAGLGLAVVFFVGVGWLAVALGDLSTAVAAGLLPFAVKGVVEVLMAAAAVTCWNHLQARRNESQDGV